MADYIQAFKKGLEAAEAADRARKEIDSVFEDLDRQLREGTGGKIAIKRKEFEVKGMTTIWTPWTAGQFLPGSQKETYWAIVAYNPQITNSPVKQLAIWRQARAGYPCKITWENVEHACEDKRGLEGALAMLLADPLVGETIHSLMQLEEKTPKKD